MPLGDLDHDNPYRSPAAVAEGASPEPPEEDGAVGGARHVMEPLTRASGWITFAGVLLIIYGASMALFLVGIPFLWCGILLVQAPGRIKEGHRRGDPARMREGAELLRKAAKVWGVTTIVGFALMILIYGVMFAVLVAAAANGELR